jgi:hypothetical protein
MPVAPISLSQLYDLPIANGVSPSPLMPHPTAWQTAVDGAKGTVAKGFPSDGDEVLKDSFDHGKAVQTLIVRDYHGPQVEITDNLYTNTVKIIKLDPHTGMKTQYYETFTEDLSGNFKASGNLALANPSGSVSIWPPEGDPNRQEGGVLQNTADGETLGVEISDANPAVTEPALYPSISNPSLWGPEVFITAPLGNGNPNSVYSNEVEAVWMNTGGATNPQATANRSEMTTAYQDVDLSQGSFTSKK